MWVTAGVTWGTWLRRSRDKLSTRCLMSTCCWPLPAATKRTWRPKWWKPFKIISGRHSQWIHVNKSDQKRCWEDVHWLLTWKMFPFDEVIMFKHILLTDGLVGCCEITMWIPRGFIDDKAAVVMTPPNHRLKQCSLNVYPLGSPCVFYDGVLHEASKRMKKLNVECTN